MTNNDAVAADQFRMMVEMGVEYTPSAELQSALDNVRSVLKSETSDVEGFGWDEGVAAVVAPVRSFSFSTGFQKVEVTYEDFGGKGKTGDTP